ncbi:MAG: hypothetical protein NZT92_14140 [Abditibacteriales bacterium]|nr:hypothetical protein [Abditibacteriales bacterium]MDW8367058.1 hypothetical protein [Abditibacteriales bacterium]
MTTSPPITYNEGKSPGWQRLVLGEEVDIVLRLRCPACGTDNYDAFITFPNCVQCRENLLACRYCRHFPGDGEACSFRPDVGRVDNLSYVEDCAHRVSTLMVEREATLTAMGPRMWAASALVCMVFGLVVVAIALLNTAVPSLSRAAIVVSPQMPETVHLNSEVEARLTINAAPGTLPSRFYVRLPKNFLSHNFTLINMTPRPVAHEIRGSGQHYFEFSVAPGTQQMTVCMRLRAVRLGSCELVARVVTGDLLTDAHSGTTPFTAKTINISIQKEQPKKPVGQTFQPLSL